MPPKGSSKKMKSYTSYTFKEHTYKAGEDVHVLVEEERGKGPKISIGRVNGFKIPASTIAKAAERAAKQASEAAAAQGFSAAAAAKAAAAAAEAVAAAPSDEKGVPPAEVAVDLVWWYRPEEARGGRKQFHGEREVFKSSHGDEVEAFSLDGPARVYTLASYQSLDRVKPGDYFWRFTYLPPPLAEFRPEKVPIYCRCSLPYNPDTFMIMCNRCEDWFHPRCVGLSKDGVSAAIASREYSCPQCTAAAAAAKGGG